MIPVQKHMRAQAGFTLVELAIVMIIIGLLIAGVLKGQALIQNAQVTSTVAQVKATEAAISTLYVRIDSGGLGEPGHPLAQLCGRLHRWRWCDQWQRPSGKPSCGYPHRG
jgi:prepilin-type N-terminal cleavage/methylation domain-containing protein